MVFRHSDPELRNMAVVKFQNPPFLIPANQIQFRGGPGHFAAHGELQDGPKTSMQKEMQELALTVDEFTELEIQYTVHLIRKYGQFMHCKECGQRGTRDAIIRHIANRSCDKEKAEDKFEP